MRRPLDRHRLRKLLGMLGSDHDGEVLNAARHIDAMVKAAGATWQSLIPDRPGERPGRSDADLERLDQLIASPKVSDVLKIRLKDMRDALRRGRLPEAERRLLRMLHRKAVIEGTFVEP